MTHFISHFETVAVFFLCNVCVCVHACCVIVFLRCSERCSKLLSYKKLSLHFKSKNADSAGCNPL